MKSQLPVCLFVALCALSPGAGHAEEKIPPAAQAPFERGLAAVDQKEWDLAARYFAEAQRAAKTHPMILFNLGLAHARAAHELLGRYWLRAYLYAAPHAPNAEAVRQELVKLEVAIQAKLAAIIGQALIAASKIEKEFDRNTAHRDACSTQAMAGDIEGAIKCQPQVWVKNAFGTAPRDDLLWRRHGEMKATAGDVAEARRALMHARPDPRLVHAVGYSTSQVEGEERYVKHAISRALYDFYLYVGNWDEARQTMLSLPADNRRGMSLEDIDKQKQASAKEAKPSALDSWLNEQSPERMLGGLEGEVRKAVQPPATVKEIAANLRQIVESVVWSLTFMHRVERKLELRAAKPRPRK
jgi:hypothetical protein